MVVYAGSKVEMALLDALESKWNGFYCLSDHELRCVFVINEFAGTQVAITRIVIVLSEAASKLS